MLETNKTRIQKKARSLFFRISEAKKAASPKKTRESQVPLSPKAPNRVKFGLKEKTPETKKTTIKKAKERKIRFLEKSSRPCFIFAVS